MPRIVADTNIYISAANFAGTADEVLALGRAGLIEICISPAILDEVSKGTPRFNMPFELGLAVATAHWRPAHQWFLFEAKPFRVQRTLSDLGGTDAYIHAESSRGLLIALTRLTYADLFGTLEDASAHLGRKVAPTIYSPRELARRRKQDSAFVTRVLEQPKLWLIGDEGDLAA